MKLQNQIPNLINSIEWLIVETLQWDSNASATSSGSNEFLKEIYDVFEDIPE